MLFSWFCLFVLFSYKAMKEDPVQKCRLVYTQNVQMFPSESFIIILVLSVYERGPKAKR